jgi:bifunctional non-homologous end joining protein LigD
MGLNMIKIKVNSQAAEITHPSKILFPKRGITKMDVVQYYLDIADYLLPVIKHHPITIRCFPDGIEAPGFFRQHAPANLPDWFKTAPLKLKMGGEMRHILCRNKETLVYLANQNTIEIHRWLSTAQKPEIPDIMLIDIDPPEDRFDLACKAAKLLKIPLEKKGYKPSLILTGSKGIHIISSCKDGKNYDQIKSMLYELTAKLSETHQGEFSTNVRKKMREGAVYLDISRNNYGQASIAPFSLRARRDAPVATPIGWDELDEFGIEPDKYNIRDIFERLKIANTSKE